MVGDLRDFPFVESLRDLDEVADLFVGDDFRLSRPHRVDAENPSPFLGVSLKIWKSLRLRLNGGNSFGFSRSGSLQYEAGVTKSA